MTDTQALYKADVVDVITSRCNRCDRDTGTYKTDVADMITE